MKTPTLKTLEQLRSRYWFAAQGVRGIAHRQHLRQPFLGPSAEGMSSSPAASGPGPWVLASNMMDKTELIQPFGRPNLSVTGRAPENASAFVASEAGRRIPVGLASGATME